MKKSVKQFSKSLPPVRVYVEDLLAAVELLESEGRKITFQTDEFEFDETSELVKHFEGETINRLYVSGSPSVGSANPTAIYFDLDRKRATVAAGNYADQTVGQCNKIFDVLNKCALPIWERVSTNIVFILIASLVFLELYSILSRWNPLSPLHSILGFGLLFTSIFLMYRSYYLESHYSQIIFKKRKDSPSFIQRNGEKIVMIAIGSIITLVIQSIPKLFYSNEPAPAPTTATQPTTVPTTKP